MIVPGNLLEGKTNLFLFLNDLRKGDQCARRVSRLTKYMHAGMTIKLVIFEVYPNSIEQAVKFSRLPNDIHD